jgi:hypothetical protein
LAQFEGATVHFQGARFSAGDVKFDGAQFSGGTVTFEGAELTGSSVTFDGAVYSGGTVAWGPFPPPLEYQAVPYRNNRRVRWWRRRVPTAQRRRFSRSTLTRTSLLRKRAVGADLSGGCW